MPTYLVRIIETHDIVGIFSADNILQLIIIVDECTEPDDCEYARLSAAGGIHVDQSGDPNTDPAYRRGRWLRAGSDALERGDRHRAVVGLSARLFDLQMEAVLS